MKLHSTLTFGLAMALAGAAGSNVAAQQATYPSAAYAASTPYATPATGYSTNGYAAPPTGYQYPTATPTAPAVSLYGQQPAAAAPQATVIGPGGYPIAPVHVAQSATRTAPAASDTRTAPASSDTRTAPAGSGSRETIVAPTLNAPAEVTAPVVQPPVESWDTYTAPPTTAPAHAHGTTTQHDGGYQQDGGYHHGGGYCAEGCDLGVSYASSAPSRQWFFGLYGLLLERQDRASTPVAVQLPNNPGPNPTFPQPDDPYLSSGDAGFDFRGGAEVRFGSTFGRAVDGCTGDCYQPFAWELAYWGITDDPSEAFLIDQDGVGGGPQIFGQVDYSGLVFEDGGGGAINQLNEFVDFQNPPGSNPGSLDIQSIAVRVRSNFAAQNLELNFWRFGSPFSGSVAAAGGHGGCADGSCGYDTCGAACKSAAPKRFFVSALAGVRYFRTDEDFQTAVFFADPAEPTDIQDFNAGGNFSPGGNNQLLVDGIEIDNELIGFQLGCSLNRLVGCRWTLFCDTNFGIYNNDIEQFRAVFSGEDSNTVQFESDGSTVFLRSSDSEVAFLGEARCGVAYQISKRARLTAAWRAIALSGVATAEGQLDNSFITRKRAEEINSDRSIILHGLQAGIEFKY